jgi:ribosomal protein L37AE/L43A
MPMHECPTCHVRLQNEPFLIDVWTCARCLQSWWLPHAGMTAVAGREVYPAIRRQQEGQA